MVAIAWYLLKVTICSGILLGYYWVALRNKLFHQYNRFYLLFTIVLSVLLPFVQINFWQNTSEQSSAIKVIEAVSYGNNYVNDFVINATPTKHTFNWQILYPIVYFIISLLLSVGFTKMLFQIRTLLKKYPTQKIEEVTFVNTENEKGTPFSFLKYIFWNREIDTYSPQGNQIFKHELAHIKEKHTYDKLFINIVLIVFWFNPFFWLLRKELNLIHEFIADKKAVEDGDTGAFAAMLLKTIYPQHQFAIANNFFYSPIKRRLLMLTKIKNTKVNYIGRILVLPLAVLVLAAFTFKVNKQNTHLYNGKKVIVVIDAGHGGERDFGASNNGVFEKDLNLSLAKFIKSFNTNNAIEIILSRDEDVYQPVTEKVKIVNDLNADLYITIHTDKALSANTKSGINFFVSKNQYPNSAKSKTFASSLINEFPSNFPLSVTNTPLQRQVGIWVLQNVKAPSVLIEAGFINNDKDMAYLKSQQGKEAIANNILMGIEKYLNQKEVIKNITTDTIPINNTLIVEENKQNVSNEKINVLPSRKKVEIATNVNTDNGDFIYSKKLNNNVNNTNQLYIVNGIETSKEELEKITGDKIKDVRILKGETAVATYGEKGKNGVIIINLKLASSDFYIDKLTANDEDLKKLGKSPYIEIDGKGYEHTTLQKISKMTGVTNFNSIRFYSPEEAIKKFGNKATDGAIIAITKKTLVEKSSFINPNFYVGNLSSGRKELSQFKKQTQINISDGYTFESATVYFSDKGFSNVVVSNIYTDNLSTIKNLIDKCTDGTSVTFDNIRVKKQGVGTIVIDGASFLLYENNNDDNSKTTASNIYSIPLKVHLANDGKINTYNMLGNGSFPIDKHQLVYVDGKINKNFASLNSSSIKSMETYDALAGEKTFGTKGKNGVLLLTTK